MPRPQPIIIPGPMGMGESRKTTTRTSPLEAVQFLSALANLYQGTIGEANKRETETQGATQIAKLLGIGEPKPTFESQPVQTGEGGGLVNMPAPMNTPDVNAIAASKQGQAGLAKLFEQKNAPEEWSAVQSDLGPVMAGKKSGKFGELFNAPKTKTDKQYTAHVPVPDKTSSTGWRQMIWEESTGNFDKPGPPAPPPMSTQTGVPKVADISGIRKEFEGTQIYKDYVTVKPQAEKIKQAYESIGKNNVAVDQTIITVLNKMLDPTSVVRESEYARTPQNLSLINRAAGILEKTGAGGAGLTDEDRKSILDMALKFSDITESYYKEHEKSFRDIADYYGVKHNLIITTPKFKFVNEAPKDNLSTLSDAELMRQLNGK